MKYLKWALARTAGAAAAGAGIASVVDRRGRIVDMIWEKFLVIGLP